MVFILYMFGNGLMLFTVRAHLRVSWWVMALLTLVQAVLVYQILHYIWMGNIFVVFAFFLLYQKATRVRPYKLMYLNMVAVAYTTACNLVFYMVWGPSYTWLWEEVGWMLLAYTLTAPPVALAMGRLLWPRLERLALPASRWLWIVPAFAIVIMMLVGAAHVQYLMTDYEEVYGLTSILVVLLTTGVSLMTLLILEKNQAAANHRHDMETIEVQIASQSHRHHEVLKHVDEVRMMRHDLRHHVRIASMLLNEGNLEALRTFLGDMACDKRLCNSIVYSDNHISDLVAHHAMLVAQEANISLSIRCALPKAFWVSDADLCILLGNLTDNALNACRMQAEGARTVLLTTVVRSHEAIVYVENSCGDAVLDTPDRRQEAGISPSGGYGLQSVRSIAEKYNGIALFERLEGRYKSSVLLYRPKQEAVVKNDAYLKKDRMKSVLD